MIPTGGNEEHITRFQLDVDTDSRIELRKRFGKLFLCISISSITIIMVVVVICSSLGFLASCIGNPETERFCERREEAKSSGNRFKKTEEMDGTNEEIDK